MTDRLRPGWRSTSRFRPNLPILEAPASHGLHAVPKSRSNHKLNAYSREEIKLLCLDNLLASSDEVVYFKDADSRFLLVSEGWLARIAPGMPVEDVIGKTDFDFFSRQHAEPAFLDEQRIVATGESVVAKLEREVYPNRPDILVSSTRCRCATSGGHRWDVRDLSRRNGRKSRQSRSVIA